MSEAGDALEEALELHETGDPVDRGEYAGVAAALARVRHQQIRFSRVRRYRRGSASVIWRTPQRVP